MSVVRLFLCLGSGLCIVLRITIITTCTKILKINCQLDFLNWKSEKAENLGTFKHYLLYSKFDRIFQLETGLAV